MAERELDIIEQARITLNDTNANNYRWSTARLMQLLTDAQDDMCENAPMLVRKYNVTTVSGEEEYTLPSDCVKLLHASSYVDDGSPMPTKTISPIHITSYDEIERDNPSWESDFSSDFSRIVVNALSQNVIRPYPRLAEDTAYSKVIKTRYQATPVDLGWDDVAEDSIEELEINPMWDAGLKQYVIAMAFLDYGDEASTTRANTALALYNKVVAKAQKLAKKGFAKRVVTTGYRARVFHYTGGMNYGYRNTRRRY